MESLTNSADVGFDVSFYVGYDDGDVLWDNDAAHDEIRDVVQTIVKTIYEREPQSQAPNGIVQRKAVTHLGLSLRMVHCQGGSMVSATNCAISQAYEDGAEYWYRVNDDTLLNTPDWIHDFNRALLSFDPPNVGIVGPTDNLNDRILTYDYVHRTHWEIFGFQYPPFLRNWWCDDWITLVYGMSFCLFASRLESFWSGGTDKYSELSSIALSIGYQLCALCGPFVSGRGRTARLPNQKVFHQGHGSSRYDVKVSYMRSVGNARICTARHCVLHTRHLCD